MSNMTSNLSNSDDKIEADNPTNIKIQTYNKL